MDFETYYQNFYNKYYCFFYSPFCRRSLYKVVPCLSSLSTLHHFMSLAQMSTSTPVLLQQMVFLGLFFPEEGIDPVSPSRTGGRGRVSPPPRGTSPGSFSKESRPRGLVDEGLLVFGTHPPEGGCPLYLLRGSGVRDGTESDQKSWNQQLHFPVRSWCFLN